MAISRSQLVKELEPGLNALFGMVLLCWCGSVVSTSLGGIVRVVRVLGVSGFWLPDLSP